MFVPTDSSESKRKRKRGRKECAPGEVEVSKTHTPRSGLYVSGKLEQPKERTTMSSTAMPYTGGDFKNLENWGRCSIFITRRTLASLVSRALSSPSFSCSSRTRLALGILDEQPQLGDDPISCQSLWPGRLFPQRPVVELEQPIAQRDHSS
ncbi:hypothetical protein U1Q18_008675 [Sarracenia purpurea var. burkii]